MMPFLTEELYQKLPNTPTKRESITIAEYPIGNNEWENEEIENIFDEIFNFVKVTRSVIASVNIPPSVKLKVFVVFNEEGEKQKRQFEENKRLAIDLAKISEVNLQLYDLFLYFFNYLMNFKILIFFY